MNCNECEFPLSAHLDRELRPDEQGEVVRHLAACSPCQREMSSLLLLKEEMRRLPLPSIPAELIAEIESQTVFRMRWREALRPWWIPTFALATGFAAWLLFHGAKPVRPGSSTPVPVAQMRPADLGLTLAPSPVVAWQLAPHTMTTKD